MTITATMAGAIAMMGNMMLFAGGREGRGGMIGGIIAMIVAFQSRAWPSWIPKTSSSRATSNPDAKLTALV